MGKQKPTIMVVEDEILLLQAISKKLELNGITAIPYSNGRDAIDYLDNLSKLPDAIWLDYQLKDMDGIEFMEHLKEKEAWAQIPVIVVSNSASKSKVHRMLTLGVRKYFLKAAHRLDELIPIVKQFIEENNTQI